ncbi:MAG: hypothetical protein E7167_02000 [Firmicutes bacterium]|nr:hypothetical protein [Bacillota bacterium]
MKKIIAIFMVLVFMFSVIGVAYAAESIEIEEPTTTSEDNIPSETLMTVNSLISSIERDKTKDMDELEELIDECAARMDAAKQMKESAEDLGYHDEHAVILLAEQEYENAKADKKFYKDTLKKQEEKYWNKKRNQYPVATEIWLYLKDEGYNDYVCAGILGNLMAEVGGQTLNINPLRNSGNGYYGMCQWSKKYYPKVVGEDLNGQLEFLNSNIKTIINKYGKNYKSDFNYSKFKKLKNEKEAAKAFAACYERCASYTYSQRMKNATVAYEYFVR